MIEFPPPSGLATGLTALSVARSTAPGTPAFSIFTVAKRAVVTIHGLSITNGIAPNGGGINNAGTLTLDDVTLNDDSAVGPGSGSAVAALGGAIDNTGTLSLSGCSLFYNTASMMPSADD